MTSHIHYSLAAPEKPPETIAIAPPLEGTPSGEDYNPTVLALLETNTIPSEKIDAVRLELLRRLVGTWATRPLSSPPVRPD
ncbi:uncharacterized protein BP01DRAFT_385572 [Aspergillus saccharolyticus JOP 1030-1]|uniref:Uncharacterized protein n=1 Tax=Aspergillus saccharolyticus JOP 1030-1 TaxID=1450539 RepID=A0A319A492_9EURO|nr:hypothetical protein BP01DRAFT_385572 [Aspergillus saccharolyticus JOP 1030-1]PYH42252.1 hypothetical protein BP01DRAFT_385572 [Aspergillus saccharolyticus JOP 1030-1]